MIDKAIDDGDGPCNGTFRGDPNTCPNWSGWPFYWVANGSTINNDPVDQDPNARRDF
jgi:hypothetical protein